MPTESPDETTFIRHQWDYDKLTAHAVDLLNSQRNLLTIVERKRQICYMLTYFIFEAAVTLSIAICRDSTNTKIDEWRKERDAAIEILESVQGMDNSDLTQQDILVLRIIQGKRPATTTHLSTPNTKDFDTEDLFTASSVSSTAWPLLEPQSALAPSLFPMDAFQPADYSGSTQDDIQNRLSAFDFLFSTDLPL